MSAENIKTILCDTPGQGSILVARRIASLIQERTRQGLNTVLGLATGSTPIQVYQELIRLHKEEGLSFQKVITFNLDEYHPMDPKSEKSYYHFMKSHLFDHVDILPENTHIPSGTTPDNRVDAECENYEEALVRAGGIDLQILGIGRTGHIGFNEPGSAKDSQTRRILLDELTRKDAAAGFGGEAHVPTHAITMGVGTILKAREIILMAWGASKAEILARTVEGEESDKIPATFLKGHPNLTFYADKEAAGQLKHVD